MSIDMNAVTEAVKRAGRANTRITKGPDDRYQIEINESGSWKVIQAGVSQKIAEDLVSRAVNKVILG